MDTGGYWGKGEFWGVRGVLGGTEGTAGEWGILQVTLGDAEKWDSLLGIAEYCWLMCLIEGTKMY